MANHLKVFENETAYSAFTGSSEYVTPNVSVCSGGGGSIFYNPLVKHDYSKDYFTLVALEDGQFKFTVDGCEATPVDSHYYSIDNGQTWTELPANTYTPTITAGNKVLWKNNMQPGYMAGTFVSTSIFEAQGNAMSLVYGDNFANKTNLEGYNFALKALFISSNIKNANNLSLPATELAWSCYADMFESCTGLTTAPKLRATTLARACYSGMFFGCKSLTTAPELRAEILADSCYSGMFNLCTSLTTAPELRAEILAVGCYYNMFNGCTNLNNITCLATDISASYCTTNWLSGVASSGTFTKAAGMTSWTTGASGIPSGWTVLNK